MRFEDLPDSSLSQSTRDSVFSLSDENITSDAVVDADHLIATNNLLINSQQHSLANNWSSLYDQDNPSNFEYSYFEGSQPDVLDELQSVRSNNLDVAKHQYQLSYELALDNMLTPFANHVPTAASPLTISSKQK